MPEFSFSTRVLGLDLDNPVALDALFSTSIDVSPFEADGEMTLFVTLQATDARRALDSLLAHLANQPAPIEVVRVDLDLVNIPEIAIRANVSRETVRLWSNGERLSAFPASFASVGDSRVWAWADIHAWLVANRKKPVESYGATPLPTQLVERVNGMLARQRVLRTLPGVWAQSRVVVAPALKRVQRPPILKARPFVPGGSYLATTHGLVA